MAVAQKADPYNLDPHFELALVYLCCSRPRFFGRIGEHLDEEALEDESAKLALRIAKVVAKEKGQGPTSLSIIGQRLHRLKQEGKVDAEQINDVLDIFDAVEENGVPAEEDAAQEIIPILRRRVQGQAVKDAITAYGKQGDLKQIASVIEKAERLGNVENSIGINMDGAWEAMDALAALERLPCGIPELDLKMDGGSEKGSLTCYVGGAGDGKSMMLQQVCCSALLKGMNVSYATLELNKGRTYSRIISNLTSVPINGVLGQRKSEAMRKLESMRPTLGMLFVEQFTPQLATIMDIQDWVKRLEEKTGEDFQVIIVDYGDKLGIPGGKEQNSYIAGRDIFEKYRVWMEEAQKWGFTASQSKRRDKNKKALIDIDDLADSQHKARVVDIVVSLNVSEDDEGEKVVKFFIAKNRNGDAGFSVGPIPCDFPMARIAVADRSYTNKPKDNNKTQKNLYDFDDEEDY